MANNRNQNKPKQTTMAVVLTSIKKAARQARCRAIKGNTRTQLNSVLVSSSSAPAQESNQRRILRIRLRLAVGSGIAFLFITALSAVGHHGRQIQTVFKRIKGTLTGKFMLDDGLWIVTLTALKRIRFMTILCSQRQQFRHIAANKFPLRVKFLRLAGRVENTEVGGAVGTGGGAPLPAAIVGRQI